MLEFIFWLSVCIIFYAYMGYLITLILIKYYQKIFYKKEKKSTLTAEENVDSIDVTPQVSFIITAYNEEKRITDKIKNSLALTYPMDRLEIIVASDCSDDRTDEIVRSYADKGIKLVRSPERKGKENAQMHAVQAAKGSILVFSDVATILKPDAIDKIVDNFKNPIIGCVSSEDRFIDRQGNISGEGLYVKYEMFLRKVESQVNTLVGLSGSFFAARREVCNNWAPDLQSDFNTLLNSVKMGLKGISDPLSIGYYENISNESKEFQRKVRTVLRGITVLMRNKHLLNYKHYGMFAWQLLSHKICRWLVPFFLISALLTNLFIAKTSIVYAILFLLQFGFYCAAVVHYFLLKQERERNKAEHPNAQKQRRGRITALVKSIFFQIARISYYFVTVNSSILVAWIKYLSGKRAIYWEPSKR
ncbi:MAG: glycosyltransferase family 2 protein [Desulfobacteraceae bacterium]|jgi:glycosyltransferase involved in cell wall biosynthesis